MPTCQISSSFLRALASTACALLVAMLLSACAGQALPKSEPELQAVPPPPPTPAAGVPDEAPLAPEAHAVVVSPVSGGVAKATNIPQRPSNVTLLAYADKVRGLSGPELAGEIGRLNEQPEPARAPADDLQLAIALAQTRVPADLSRAQMLLQRVLNNGQEEVRALHPLARLLAARFSDQKRMEEQIDRQAQLLRDSQRRIDQLNDRLEAMRAVERSLTSRGAPAAPVHNGGSATGNGLRAPPAP